LERRFERHPNDEKPIRKFARKRVVLGKKKRAGAPTTRGFPKDSGRDKKGGQKGGKSVTLKKETPIRKGPRLAPRGGVLGVPAAPERDVSQ